MSQVSRPVQVLLLVTVLFGAVWFVALRPKGASSGGTAAPPAQQADAPGAQGLKSAVDKAHDAAGTAQADADRAGATSADGTASKSGGATTAAPTKAATTTHAAAHKHTTAHKHAHKGHPAARAVRFTRADAARLRAVRSAVRHHRAVAIGFVDPATADGRGVAVELRHVSEFGGRALAVSVPIAQLSRYDFITHDVQVTVAPTTVIVARNGEATTIVGFADRGEIQQDLADALAVKR
jgi:hypothetical protein